jgi:hypothetical protein
MDNSLASVFNIFRQPDSLNVSIVAERRRSSTR